MPFGGSHTPRMCMLTTVAAILHRTQHGNWDVNKEMKGWRMEGGLVLLPYVEGGDPESHATISLKDDTSGIHILFFFACEKGNVSKVRKNSAVLKRAMTARRTGWSGRDWNSKPQEPVAILARGRSWSPKVGVQFFFDMF